MNRREKALSLVAGIVRSAAIGGALAEIFLMAFWAMEDADSIRHLDAELMMLSNATFGRSWCRMGLAAGVAFFAGRTILDRIRVARSPAARPAVAPESALSHPAIIRRVFGWSVDLALVVVLVFVLYGAFYVPRFGMTISATTAEVRGVCEECTDHNAVDRLNDGRYYFLIGFDLDDNSSRIKLAHAACESGIRTRLRFEDLDDLSVPLRRAGLDLAVLADNASDAESLRARIYLSRPR